MTWSVPLTAVDGPALTAAQWNASVRDNLLETAPGKATTAGYHFASVGANQIAERAILSAQVQASENTTSTSYADLPGGTVGPSVTLTTGTQALVWLDMTVTNSSGANFSAGATNVSGASSIGPSIDNGVTNTGTTANRQGVCWLATGLTSGSNQFKIQYRVNGGTGSFGSRTITVMGL